MRLESIHLRNYRGVADRKVEFGQGVTVVEGENEAGKSSLMEAIRFLRLYPHTSRRQDLKDAAPIGVDAGPEVTLEATVGEDHVRYTKRWLKSPTAVLQVTGSRREDYSGAAAHDQFISLLENALDLDLLQALEVTQGLSLDQPELGRVSTLRSALSSEPGSDQDQSDELLAAVEAEYEKYYTRTGLPRGRFKAVAAEVEKAVQKLADLQRSADEAEELAHTFASAREKDAELALLLSDAEQAHAALALRQAEVDAAVQEKRDAAGALEALNGKVGLAKTLLDHHLAQQARLREARQAATEASEALEVAKETEATLRQEVEDTQASADEARDQWAGSHAKLEEAQAVEARLERAAELSYLRALLHRIENTQREEQESRKRAAKYLVDDPALARLRALDSELLQAKSALEAASATVLVEPLNGQTTILADGVPLDGSLEETVSEPLVVEVPGEVRVTVSPARAAGSYKERAEEASKELEQALAEVGATSVEDGARQNSARREAAAEALAAAGRLSELVRDQSVDQIQDEIAALEAASDAEHVEASGGEPTTNAEAVGSGAASLEAARSATVNAIQEERTLRRSLDEKLKMLSAAESKWDAAKVELAHARKALEGAKEREAAALVELEGPEGSSKNEDALRFDLVRAQLKFEEGEKALAQAQAALDALDPEMTKHELGETADVIADLKGQRDELGRLQVRTKALLDQAVARGLHDKIGQTQSELLALESEAEDLEKRAAAARKLWEVLNKHRNAAQERYAAPLEMVIRDLGQPVFGPDLDVKVGADLKVVSRSVGGPHIPFASLSAGAREQLSVLGRLAAATLVEEKGAPVILDDTLGFSDPERLESLGAVLSGVGDKAQIIILTCQPGRYQSVESATTVKL